MTRLVVDTNIIISALIRDSLTRKALLYPYFEFFAPEGIRMEIGRNMDEIVHKSGVPLKRVGGVLDTLFERVALIPFRDLSGHYKEANGCDLAPSYRQAYAPPCPSPTGV